MPVWLQLTAFVWSLTLRSATRKPGSIKPVLRIYCIFGPGTATSSQGTDVKNKIAALFLWPLLIVFLDVLMPVSGAQPLGQDFNYQGRLSAGAVSTSGSFDLQFTLYDRAQGGSIVAGPATNAGVSVIDGLFSVFLHFDSNAFDGGAKWLEIGVRANGEPAAFTILSPRQPITATPYASYAIRGQAAAVADIAMNVPDSFWPANSNNLNQTLNATNWPPAWDAARLRNLRTNGWPAIINVKDFGAQGIGADDSVALANAFQAWTNRGGTLYFPAGTYVDTNRYLLSAAGAYDGSPWTGLDIRGDGQAITKWNVCITNGTFLWSTNIPIGLHDIRVTDIGAGTNHFFRMSGAPQGSMTWSFCSIIGFRGYGADFGSEDAGELRAARFDGCGVGFRIGGYGDGWNGSAELTKSIWAGCIIGFTNSSSYGQRYAHGHTWYLMGNLNNNGVILGPGFGNNFAGAFESVTNAVFAIGYPPGLPDWIDAPQDATSGIGTVRIHDLNLLSNGTPGSALVKLYGNPLSLTLDGVAVGIGGVLVQSTSTQYDTTPIDIRGCWASTNVLFGDHSYIVGAATVPGRQNALVNSTIWVFNKTNSNSPGMTNGQIEASKSPDRP